MMVEYSIVPTKFLIEQISELDDKTKKIIREKKELIKINPFRYKKVHTNSYHHVFSVKLTSKNESKRLIYIVLNNVVFLCFILDRSKEYKDLEKYLKKIGKEIQS